MKKTNKLYSDLEIEFFKYIAEKGHVFNNITFNDFRLVLTPILACFIDDKHYENITIKTSWTNEFFIHFTYRFKANSFTMDRTINLKIRVVDSRILCSYRVLKNENYANVSYPFMSTEYLKSVNLWFKEFDNTISNTNNEIMLKDD